FVPLLFGIVGQGGREPGAGERPFAVGGGPRQPQRRRRFLDRQAGKHPRLDDLGGQGLLGGQQLQGVVQLQEPLVAGGGRRLETGEGDARGKLFAPRRFDQDAAHGLGGGGEEVATVGELLIPDQAQVRLVHQRRGVEGLAGLLAREVL